MSIWTHLTGLVRLDALVGIIPMTAKPFDIFATNIPMGSEGPAHIQFNEYPVKEIANDPRYGFVAIWGDLRDYSDEQKIQEWFRASLSKTANSGFMIRSAILLVEVEGRSTVMFRYDPESGKVSIEREGI